MHRQQPAEFQSHLYQWHELPLLPLLPFGSPVLHTLQFCEHSRMTRIHAQGEVIKYGVQAPAVQFAAAEFAESPIFYHEQI